MTHFDPPAADPLADMAPVGDMSSEELQRWGHAVVDWISTYLDSIEEYPVLPGIAPGQLRSRLPPGPPEEGEPFEAILSDFQELIVPSITHWNHPAFNAYFAVTGSGPGILGEALTAALNANAMLWKTSPAGTELEELVMDWTRQLLGLPSHFRGVIQDTASTSTLVALAAARHRSFEHVRDQGLSGRSRGRIYASEEAHSSVEKAAIVLGFGRNGLRRIQTDEEFRMLQEALQSAIAEDEEAGIQPVAIVATIGTTVAAAVDPVAPIAETAARCGCWLHVDAAYAGAAAIVPELRSYFEGWERADSIVFNPHKWLFTPLDCSALFTRDAAVLKDSLGLTPTYLSSESDEATNLMHYGVALGRRFRALKLWFVQRYFGAKGLRDRIRAHVAIAQSFASWVDREPGWERVAPTHFSTVAFRYVGDGLGRKRAGDGQRTIDDWNLAIMRRVNASGEAFISQAQLGPNVVLRVAVGNLRTEERHLRHTWQLLRDAAARETVAR